jgi:hypothetical protein
MGSKRRAPEDLYNQITGRQRRSRSEEPPARSEWRSSPIRQRPAVMDIRNIVNPVPRSVMSINNMLNPIQRVTNQGNPVRITFDVERTSNGIPSNITMIPGRLVGEVYNEETLRYMANRLRREVLTLLRRAYPNRSESMLQRAYGNLLMQNHENENHTYSTDIPVTEITMETFLDSFDRAASTGSNPNIQIRDVDWIYWINPASLNVGAGTFTNPENLKGVVNWNKKLKIVCDVNTSMIGCAAIALANSLQLILKDFDDQRYKRIEYTRFVNRLQTRLNFDNPKAVNIVELKKIVELYPDFRLVVVHSSMPKPSITCGANYQFVQRRGDKSLYIYYDQNSAHFVSISGYYEFCKSKARADVRVCYKCCVYVKANLISSICDCEAGVQGSSRVRTKYICYCGQEVRKDKKKEHRCGETSCKFCHVYFKNDNYRNHRCPIFVESKVMDKKFSFDEISQNEMEEEPPELWAWDIESEIVYVRDENGNIETHEQFEKDENGVYKQDEEGNLIVTFIQRCSQLCNYIYCRNVFSGEEFEFDNLESFVQFATVDRNNGKNYFYAHNSAGYDTRLLFEAICRFHRSEHISKPLLRGSKYLQLTVNDTQFHDSMLHLPGSLKNQGKAFNLQVTKGDFPHGFSFAENIDYQGPIPAIEYFPDRFKTKEELDEFKEWHKEMEDTGYVWNYKEERKKYCRTDVYILAEILRLYHESTLELVKDYPHLQVSPLFFPTVAGYHHKLQLRHLHIEHDLKSMTEDQINEYARTTWCNLQPAEYYFARSALRGGMTNIYKYNSEKRLHYVDIQSSYPSCQLSRQNLYPVGPPIIEVHDLEYYPCPICVTSQTGCIHSINERTRMSQRTKMNIIQVNPINIETYLRNFTGIITIDVDPPKNLYHTLIQEYDQEKKKIIGSLNFISKITIPCIILQRALDVGYKVVKIYRADRYQLSESKWRNGLLGDMYLAKMKYAGVVPLSEQTRMKATFREKFGIDLGDMNEWENNPVRKHAAKILINCGWGKHAESVDHEQTQVYKNNGIDGMDFYESLLENKFKVTNILNIGENILFKYNENREIKKPNLHQTYLPAAVYVTAYGRLALWEELIKIDPPGTPTEKLRVVMTDTDSIIYECNDHENDYHVREGDCLGDWETEKIETKGNGIKSFYSIGPKSYSVVPNSGKPLIKLKGASLDWGHSNLITPLVMKEMVTSRITVELPQTTLDYKMGSNHKALSFRNFRKVVQFNVEDCKGDYSNEDYRMYPFGFNKE